MMPTIDHGRSLVPPGRARATEELAAEVREWRVMLNQLSGTDWATPTVCDRWTVGDIVCHAVSQGEGVVRPWLMLRVALQARGRYPELRRFDRYMEIGVDAYRALPPAVVIDKFRRVWIRVIPIPRRIPNVFRRFSGPTGLKESPSISVAHYFDVIITRDLWMHRDDIGQALGHRMVLCAHDAFVVAQVVRELDESCYSGPPAVLELTGPAGGRWQLGLGEPVATVRTDSMAYMRALSGRHQHPVLELVNGDPAAMHALEAVRVAF